MSTATSKHHRAAGLYVRQWRNGLHIIRGSELGLQLHVGHEPRRDNFPPVTMATPGIGFRPLNQAWGGLWSSTLDEDGLSRFVEVNLERGADPVFLRDSGWWLLQPARWAYVLVLGDAESFEVALSHFSYGASVELDFAAIRDAGITGVHVSEAAAREVAPLRDWMHESVHWLTFDFQKPATPTSPPDWLANLIAAEPVLRADDDGRFHLAGAYTGFWVRTGDLSAETLATALHLLQLRDRGAKSDGEDQLILIALAKLMTNEMIIEHNLVGLDGGPLPVGAGLFEALGPDLSLALADAVSQIMQRDRNYPSQRVYPAELLPRRRPRQRIRWRSRIMQERQRRYDELQRG